ncbi:MAG: hypothetical protein HC804_01150, partial [Anaerolineae bacterium]|nr:hypothetical protein [Anaerolineae bacterium]
RHQRPLAPGAHPHRHCDRHGGTAFVLAMLTIISARYKTADMDEGG